MQRRANPSLPAPERYFPIEHGRYEVKPGLQCFSGKVFQIDRQFEEFRQAKLAARRERLSKYYATYQLSPEVERAVARFMLRRLALEHPTLFTFDGQTVQSMLTGDELQFSPEGDLQGARASVLPGYVSAIDALASQVQEDLAITSTEGGRHWLSAVHLCSPNHWAAEEKIGKSFAAIHEPVAGIERINQREDQWVFTMVRATAGLMRFAWGIVPDRELNLHPDRQRRRQFDRSQPGAYLRVERQTMWGFPDVGASLFTIRTSFVDVAEIRAKPDERAALISAIQSMSEDSLRYKGIDAFRNDLLDWLLA